MRLIACALAAPLALSACMTAPVPLPGGGEPDAAACGAEGLQGLVGQGEGVLAAMTFPQGARVYRVGDPVTADYSATRLNIEIGADGRIARVLCG